MRFIRSTLILALLALPAGEAHAQRLTADLRTAVAAPTQNLADADLGTGFGFGATLAWRLQPHLHAYGGWDWMHFRADRSFAGAERDFEETGYTFGLRFEHPFRDVSRILYRLEAGGTYKHIEIEDDDGALIADSKHGLGFELGGGVLVPLGESWRFVPALRYRALSREFTTGGTTTKGDLRYTALEIGISRRF